MCVCARTEFNDMKLNKLNCVFVVGGCYCSLHKPSIMINVHWMYKMWFSSILRFGEAEHKMLVFVSNNNRSIKAYFDNIYYEITLDYWIHRCNGSCDFSSNYSHLFWPEIRWNDKQMEKNEWRKQKIRNIILRSLAKTFSAMINKVIISFEKLRFINGEFDVFLAMIYDKY